VKPAVRRVLLLIAAFACYVGIVIVRQGPPPGGDTTPLTAVTSALASGRLHGAAANDQLPNPPGYALMTAPFVALFRSAVGSPTWCTTPGRAANLHHLSAYRHDPTFGEDVGECGSAHRLANGEIRPSLPTWYRAQGILGVASWLVLALGSLALLWAAGAASAAREAGLLAFLVILPAASSAIVQLYHPQDIVSLGLALGAMALLLRNQWIAAGALFGLAVLTKQYALLLLIPALAAAPGTGPRLRVAVSAAVVFGVGLAPFFVSAPHATLANFSGFSAGGAVSGFTVLSLSGVTGSAASAIARDAPVVLALAVCIWAIRRGAWANAPVVLVALGLACVGGRLVFESVVFPYYLLASSVLFFLLDLVAQRTPHRSLAWSAAAAFFVAISPGNRAVDAMGTLILAVLAVAAGLTEVARLTGPHAPKAPPVEVTSDAV
jgi:Glycosyltransferase family 87